jgi:hypothetical protein
VPKPISRDKTKRSYPGECFGAPAAEFLNLQVLKRRRERIIGLLGLLRELADHSINLAGCFSERDSGFSEISKQVEKSIRRYKTAPMLWPTVGAVSILSGAVCEYRFKDVPSDRARGARAECDAARNLIQLADMGLLDSLRQCAYEKCGKWFFARFAHQHFCAEGDCRNEYNTVSPRAKENRQKHALKYYWDNHPARGLRKYRSLTWEQFREKILSSKRKKENHGRLQTR